MYTTNWALDVVISSNIEEPSSLKATSIVLYLALQALDVQLLDGLNEVPRPPMSAHSGTTDRVLNILLDGISGVLSFNNTSIFNAPKRFFGCNIGKQINNSYTMICYMVNHM